MSSPKKSERHEGGGGKKLLLLASLLTLGAVGVGTCYFYFMANSSDESTSLQTFALLRNARNLASYAASRFSSTRPTETMTPPPVEENLKPDELPSNSVDGELGVYSG